MKMYTGLLLVAGIVAAISGCGVPPPARGSMHVTLQWSAPATNVDGSPIADLAGYKVYYGSTSGMYDRSIEVTTPSATQVIVDNLTPDIYYFVVVAYNSAGIEGEYSNEVSGVVGARS